MARMLRAIHNVTHARLMRFRLHHRVITHRQLPDSSAAKRPRRNPQNISRVTIVTSENNFPFYCSRCRSEHSGSGVANVVEREGQRGAAREKRLKAPQNCLTLLRCAAWLGLRVFMPESRCGYSSYFAPTQLCRGRHETQGRKMGAKKRDRIFLPTIFLPSNRHVPA